MFIVRTKADKYLFLVTSLLSWRRMCSTQLPVTTTKGKVRRSKPDRHLCCSTLMTLTSVRAWSCPSWTHTPINLRVKSTVTYINVKSKLFPFLYISRIFFFSMADTPWTGTITGILHNHLNSVNSYKMVLSNARLLWEACPDRGSCWAGVTSANLNHWAGTREFVVSGAFWSILLQLFNNMVCCAANCSKLFLGFFFFLIFFSRWGAPTQSMDLL